MSVTTPDLDDVATTRLRSADQRYTRGRRRVVHVLGSATRPMTIPQILAADPQLAQSSVYRNLSILEDVGVVSRIVTGDDHAHYELAEDLTEHHHHMICTSCGDVADFELQPKTESELDRALAKVASRTGFSAESHRLDLVGTCQTCS